MSLRTLNWAFALPVKQPGRKLVLICLADYAVETNLSYPSLKCLCQQTSLGKEAVESTLESLAADGIITDTLKRVGEQKEIRVWQLNQEAELVPAPKKIRVPKNEATAEALQVYEFYPRKIGRPKALTAIARAIKTYNFEIVMNGTKLFAEAWKNSGKIDLSFCPHATTFFNGERFNDSPEAWGLSGAKNQPIGIPRYSEVNDFIKEKGDDNTFCAKVSAGFMAHWGKKSWRKNGIVIDWKTELSIFIGMVRSQNEKLTNPQP